MEVVDVVGDVREKDGRIRIKYCVGFGGDEIL